MTTQGNRRYITLADAADYAGVCTKTLRRRIADGTLSAYRFGPRVIRVDIAELDALIKPIATGGGAR